MTAFLFGICTQKYRLHTRRPGPTPQAAAAAATPLVVGIWVPPEYATAAAAAAAHGGAQAAAAAAAAATLYGAHPTPHAHHPVSQHFSVGHEFYGAPTPPPPQPQHFPLHHHAGHPLHHQFHMYKPPPSLSQAQTSPDSDARGTGDRSESIEDGKSESGSWRADSGGEKGGERRAVALRPEDGEVSNGSDITLKF